QSENYLNIILIFKPLNYQFCKRKVNKWNSYGLDALTACTLPLLPAKVRQNLKSTREVVCV
ncbi:MAG: hypothetical protein KDK90_11045, partial [Leptospiraceae bacterium]|nr:hypothetical protein [Leptospiraceae bacterium]